LALAQRVKQPVFPFGTELEANEPEPAGNIRLSDSSKAIKTKDIRNALPTPTGYTSFFKAKALGLPTLPPGTQRAFTYQDSSGNNTLVALGYYGAAYSQDGTTWVLSESLTNYDRAKLVDSLSTPLEALAVATFNYHLPLADIDFYLGTVYAANSLATPYSMELYAAQVVTADNVMNYPRQLTYRYDRAYIKDRLIRVLDFSWITLGKINTIHVDSTMGDSVYVSPATDTVADIRFGIYNNWNFRGTKKASLRLDALESRLEVKSLSAYSSTQIAPMAMYLEEEVIAGANNTPVLTFPGTGRTNEEFLLPTASVGNMCYMEFSSTSPITDSNSLWSLKSATYDTGVTFGNVDHTADGYWGSFGIGTLYKAGGKLYFPAYSQVIRLDHHAGADDPNLIVKVYDTGVPIKGVLDYTTCNEVIDLGLASNTPAVGQVLCISTVGVQFTYTVTAADVADLNVMYSNLLTAYNTALVTNTPGHISHPLYTTNYGLNTTIPKVNYAILRSNYDQFNQRTVFNPYPVTLTMPVQSIGFTRYASRTTHITHSGNASSRAFVSSSLTGDNYVELVFTLPTGTLAGETFALWSGNHKVSILDSTGFFTNANQEFTGDQILAAITAGTRLWTVLRDKQSVITRVSTAVVTPAPGFTLEFYRIYNINTRFRSRYAGAATGLVEMGSNFAAMNRPSTVYFAGKSIVDGLSAQQIGVPMDPIYSPMLHFTVPAAYNLDTRLSFGNVPWAVDPAANANINISFGVPVHQGGAITATYDFGDPIIAALLPTLQSVTINGQAMYTPGYGYASHYQTEYISGTQATPNNIYQPWSTADIKNSLYLYRNGQGAGGYILQLMNDGTGWAQRTPTFANMAQVQGIFQARGRLGMWDSANSIYLSSNLDPMDFTPAIKTGANVFKVDAVIGVSMLPPVLYWLLITRVQATMLTPH